MNESKWSPMFIVRRTSSIRGSINPAHPHKYPVFSTADEAEERAAYLASKHSASFIVLKAVSAFTSFHLTKK